MAWRNVFVGRVVATAEAFHQTRQNCEIINFQISSPGIESLPLKPVFKSCSCSLSKFYILFEKFLWHGLNDEKMRKYNFEVPLNFN
uniref:Uncharacterized protein n=1 Tax=Pararge aegeria TaxID=116150 RepID=S4P2N1_9NEOP